MSKLGALFKSIGEFLRNPTVWIPLAALAGVAVVALAVFFARGDPVWDDIQSWTFAIIVALVSVLVVVVLLMLRQVHRDEQTNRMDSGFRVADAGARGAPSADAQPGAAAPGLEGAFAAGLDAMGRAALGTRAYLELPWLLVIGQSDSGKSTMIRESGLTLPATHAELVPRDGRTEDLAWWLTNEAVVLDTAGRFLDDDSPETREEWRELLRLLRKRRGSRGLQGLVIAEDVDALLGSTASELRERGERIRRRINELTVELCFDLPVYLVLTKSDHIEGFTETCQAMSERHAGEALGWTNAERRFTHAAPLLREGIRELASRLEARLPAMLTRPDDPVGRRRILQLPSELVEVGDALAHLAETAFATAEFEDVKVPFLRGVYFVSSTQEGETRSPLLDRLGLGQRLVNRDAGRPHPRPLFLRDLFREVILPSSPLAWRTSDLGPRSRTWASAALGALSLGLLAYWCVVAFQQITRANEIRRAVTNLELDQSIAALDRARKEIADPRALMPEEIEGGLAKPVLPGLGLGWALETAQSRAKARFVEIYRTRREDDVQNRLDRVAAEEDELGFGALATVVRERRFLESRDTRDAPRVHPYSSGSDPEAPYEWAYRAYALWLDDEAREALGEEDESFIRRFSLQYQKLSSMEDWSDQNRDQIRPIGYAPVRPDDESGFRVTGIYTADGYRNFVKPYFDAVEGILEEKRRRKEDVSRELQAYEDLRRDYVESFYASWTRFLNGLPLSAADGRPLRDPLSSGHLELLATIDRNTRVGLARGSALPAWVASLHALRDEPPAPGESYCEALRPEIPEDEELAPWEAYCDALRAFGRVVDDSHSPLVTAGESSALAIARLLPEAPDEYAAAIEAARNASKVERNRPCGERVGCEEAPASLLGLFVMPIADGVSDILAGAVETLDDRWRETIRDYPGGNFASRHINSFYGPGGTLDGFLDGELRDFYRNGTWLSPIALDRSLPVGPGYRAWLRRAEEIKRNLFGQRYRPVIKTYGIDRVRADDPDLRRNWGPTAASIKVRCGDEEVEIELIGTGRWTLPEWSTGCQSVSSVIEIGNTRSEGIPVSPVWEERGPFAVPRFLRQIRNGGVTKSFDRPRATLRFKMTIEQGEGLRSIGQHPLARSMLE